MTTKQPVFIEHLLCARNYPKNFQNNQINWLIFTTTLQGRYSYYPHLTDEETEAELVQGVFYREHCVGEFLPGLQAELCPPKLLC